MNYRVFLLAAVVLGLGNATQARAQGDITSPVEVGEQFNPLVSQGTKAPAGKCEGEGDGAQKLSDDDGAEIAKEKAIVRKEGCTKKGFDETWWQNSKLAMRDGCLKKNKETGQPGGDATGYVSTTFEGNYDFLPNKRTYVYSCFIEAHCDTCEPKKSNADKCKDGYEVNVLNLKFKELISGPHKK